MPLQMATMAASSTRLDLANGWQIDPCNCNKDEFNQPAGWDQTCSLRD
jgi:hypothetical protein